MKKLVTGKIMMLLLTALMAGLVPGYTAFGGDDARETAVRGGAEKINVNAATLKELITLPGIGRKKAGAIIAYRTENGKFGSIDDLRKVEGIGKKTLEKIRPYITVP